MPENFYNTIARDKETKHLLAPKYNPQYGKKHWLDPNFRLIVTGPSGSMKTTNVVDLIKITSGTFKRIIVCVKSSDEPLYQFLDIKLPITFYEGGEVPEIETLMAETDNEKIPTLIIFDDLVNEPDQSGAIQFFLRGRKFNFSMVYISQNYYSIKKIIRVNATHIILKTLSGINDLKQILREYNLGIKLDGIMNLYKFACDEQINFFLIDIPKNKFYKNWMTLLN
jgi:hypothetical protein